MYVFVLFQQDQYATIPHLIQLRIKLDQAGTACNLISTQTVSLLHVATQNSTSITTGQATLKPKENPGKYIGFMGMEWLQTILLPHLG